MTRSQSYANGTLHVTLIGLGVQAVYVERRRIIKGYTKFTSEDAALAAYAACGSR